METKLGDGAYGETYAATSDPLPCFRDEARRMVRDADGATIVSELTLILKPGKAGLFAPGSRVTSGPRTSAVIGAQDHDDARLGAPQHTEVTCE